jgi:hypothetical protein
MKIQKGWLFIAITGILFFTFWLIFYSQVLANNQKFLILRNMYFYQLSLVLPSNKLLYSLRPVAKNESDYTYKLAGRIVSVDYKDHIMTIQDMFGRKWKIKFEVMSYPSETDTVKLSFVETSTDKSKTITNQITNILIDTKNPEKTAEYFLRNDMVIITWHDRRTVGEIKRSVFKNNQVIELTEDKIIPIAKIIND